jgi:hypothetical protein
MYCVLLCSMGTVFTLFSYSLYCQMAQLAAGEPAMSNVSARMEVQRMNDIVPRQLLFMNNLHSAADC